VAEPNKGNKKVKDKDDIRRVCIPRTSKFDYINNLFGQLFKLESFVIKYVDDENDLVTLSCDEELHEAFRLTKDNGVLRMYISSQEGTPLNVSSFYAPDNLSTSSFTNEQQPEQLRNTSSSIAATTTTTIVKPIADVSHHHHHHNSNYSGVPIHDLAHVLAEHLKTTTESVASTSISASDRIASAITKLSEQTAAAADNLASKTSSKASEVSKNIAITTLELSNQIASTNQQIAATSLTFGEQMRKETLERSLMLSEKTSETLNRLSDSTVDLVDDASARIRAVIMNIKV